MGSSKNGPSLFRSRVQGGYIEQDAGEIFGEWKTVIWSARQGVSSLINLYLLG